MMSRLSKAWQAREHRVPPYARRKAAAVREHARALAPLSNERLRERARAIRERLAGGEPLEEAALPALALGAAASERILGLAPRDEQLVAALLMHEGHAVELAVGEGKTLAGALAACPTALAARGVHVATANGYLARRDAGWMGPLFENGLGLGAAAVYQGQARRDRRAAYRADVTYGSASEMVFDYLRDLTRLRPSGRLQRSRGYLLVDEADSILIDSAQSPFVLSHGEEEGGLPYRRVEPLALKLKRDLDVLVDRGERTCVLTERGTAKARRLLMEAGLLGDDERPGADAGLLHVLVQCVRAHALFERGREYVVTPEGRVVMVDPFTGRLAPTRRWADGLHQAVEAKERVPLRPSQRPVGACSVRGWLAEYERVAGMTGTATGVEEELYEAYGLPVVHIPPHVCSGRRDGPDRVFGTERARHAALVADVVRRHRRGQPVLVGTGSELQAERISGLLSDRGVPHRTLVARDHAREAQVIANAGRRGAVTVATQLAGRGTDIRLGGDPRVLATRAADHPDEARAADCRQEAEAVRRVGGLCVLGVERGRSRRVDDQLRGRAGRGGEPGYAEFFVSMEDELPFRLTSERDRVQRERWRTVDGPIEEYAARELIARAQQVVQGRDRESRQLRGRLLGILDEHRRAFAALREAVLLGRYDRAGAEAVPDPSLRIACRRFARTVERLVARHSGEGSVHRRRLAGAVYRTLGVPVAPAEVPEDPAVARRHLVSRCTGALVEQHARLVDLVERAASGTLESDVPASGERSGPPSDAGGSVVTRFEQLFGAPLPVSDGMTADGSRAARCAEAQRRLCLRLESSGVRWVLRQFRLSYLVALDRHWTIHLDELAAQRESFALRAYGQRQPFAELRREAFATFESMLGRARDEVLEELFARPVLDGGALDEMERALLRQGRGRLASYRAPGFGPPDAPGRQPTEHG